MPSRKKAKGKARKAAQAEKNEAAEKFRELEQKFRLLEQSQIQRLQISNQSSTICMHGYEYDPFPNDDICSGALCIKFIRGFVREFYKSYRMNISNDEWRGVLGALLEARDVTTEYSEVWYDADKIKQVISYFLHNGTMHILEGKKDGSSYATHSALFARFFEQWLAWKVHKSQHCINLPKVVECGMAYSDEHTVVKFFWRRIRCSCLDKRYEEVKSRPKMGLCFNSQCEHPKRFVERSELRCCSRCRVVNYCSRKCQAADWSVHKELCDKFAASKAEFDAIRAGTSRV